MRQEYFIWLDFYFNYYFYFYRDLTEHTKKVFYHNNNQIPIIPAMHTAHVHTHAMLLYKIQNCPGPISILNTGPV